VPAGIEDGTQIRLSGEGEPGLDGGDRGDLYCEVRVESHPYFQRRGDDLLVEIPVSFTQAALGATIPVPSLGGEVEVTVPRGTNPGEVFRVRGHGVPNLHSGRKGDLHVRVTIDVPSRITDEQEELLRRFAATEKIDVRPKKRGLFEKFKDWLE
jgi:molecular chaperone DnaJ